VGRLITMKRLLKNSVIVILLFGTAIYLPSCKKEATPPTPPTLPIVTTTNVSDITQTTASAGGTVTDDGGAEVIDIGVCWSISPNPTISSTKTSNGKGTGSFNSSMTGLTPNTKYYVRAYATNSAGTSYGNEVTFNTNDIIIAQTLPTLITTEVTLITATSAVSGGTIINGGGQITSQGLCWGTTANPTISNSKTNDELLDLDYFTSNLAHLNPGTTYYVRAYATNSAGTGYGDQISFTTHQIEVATLTTIVVQSITYTTARSGGIITSDGGENITELGICWGTTVNPTPNDNKMSSMPSGVADFYILINSLQPSTKYYVRAYAINSVGIGYGNELSFTTFPNGPIIFSPVLTYGSVSDIDGNIYKTIQIGSQLWLAENLKTTKFNDGTVIPNITDNIEWQNLTTPGYSWYNNDAASYKTTFGALYNWYAVSTDKLCPTGWHVPIDSEFKTLTDYLGDNSGAKMTETGNNHWLNYITDATNVSGFTGLPGGLRYYYSNNTPEVNFAGIGDTGSWWSASENGALGSISQLSWDYYINFYQDLANKVFGMSVRCIKN
jgi:uncharacterized protein (TIGR02145 family)